MESLHNVRILSDHFADHYKLRGGVYFVNSMPVTITEKPQKLQIKQIAIELYKQRNQIQK